MRFAAALIGFAIAFAIAPHLQWRASPGELPGAMQARGLDPAGPIAGFALIVAMTFGFGVALPTSAAKRRESAATPSLDDAILLAAWLPLYFAFLDVFRGNPHWLLVAAAAVIAAMRFALPAHAFALAPLAILLQLTSLPPVLAIVWIIATPLLLRRINLHRAVPWVYALFVFAYPLALLGITNVPYLDFFEDGHELVVAHELERGERPYADIVPVHGLISDGGLDAIVDGDSVSTILRSRRVLSALNLVAIYAVVLAAAGSADLGLLAVFLAIALVPAATIWLRTIPALFALAATCASIRLRSRRWMVGAGILAVIAFLFAMDFGVYSAIVAFIVAARMRMLRAFLAGLASAIFVTAIAFVLGHFAIPFMHTTLFELLPAGRVYVPGPLQMPPDRVMFVIWIAAVVFAAATARTRMRRRDAVWAIALWAVVAGLSYAQRRHDYAAFVLPAFVVVVTWLIARRQRLAAACMVIVVVFVAHPLRHIFNVATPLRRAGGVQPGGSDALVSGVVVAPKIALGIESARHFVQTLPPGSTWFDFSNSPSLYFLLDRQCPTRQHQVPFYESEAEQREVIATLERDRSIRAALIACPGGDNAIDGVPNHVRAPLVWQYLQTHFKPAHDSDGVIFWIR